MQHTPCATHVTLHATRRTPSAACRKLYKRYTAGYIAYAVYCMKCIIALAYISTISLSLYIYIYICIHIYIYIYIYTHIVCTLYSTLCTIAPEGSRVEDGCFSFVLSLVCFILLCFSLFFYVLCLFLFSH